MNSKKKVKTKIEKDKNEFLFKKFLKISFETVLGEKKKNIELILRSLVEEAKKGDTKAIKMALELYERSVKKEAFPRNEKNIKKILKTMVSEKEER